MLEILGNSDFWAVLSGTLTALVIGGGRGYRLIRNLLKARKGVKNHPDLEAENLLLKIENSELRKLNSQQASDLAQTQRNYSRLENLYDRQFRNVEWQQSMEDELAELKEKVKVKNG